MTDVIRYVKDIQIIKSEKDPGQILIKAKGVAEINKVLAPVLVPGKNNNLSEEGIYELEFKFDSPETGGMAFEIEMDVELRIKNLPPGIKGIKITASENSDIELI
jgi:hypothetical protein